MQSRRARLALHRRQPMSLARGSWISLFAMLMIFIGPLISQSMPMDQRTSSSMSMNMEMEMGMDMTAHEGHDAEHSATQSEHHALWEKCGYCSLLFNCPALTGGHGVAVSGSPPAHLFTNPSPRLGHARPTFFPGARTRAPPLAA